MDIPAADLAQIKDLYARGLYLQAHAAAAAFGPYRTWTSPAARLIGGRLAIQLGSPRLGRQLHLLAFRSNPAYPEAIYYHARYRMEHFGPLACWEFLRQHPDWSDANPELRADWLALHGFVCGRLRDFDRADKWFAQAESLSADRAWVAVERASVYEAAERFDNALATARRALEIQPYFRPAVQAVAHVLHRTGKSAESVAFLEDAEPRMESAIVAAQFAATLLDLNRPHDARRLLDRYAELSPLLDRDTGKWLAARRADVAYLLGEYGEAATQAAAAKEEFYVNFSGRLGSPPAPDARRMLSLELGYEGEPPTVHDLLGRFWNETAPAAPGDSPPTPDGIPDAAERRRYDAAGWVTREFRLTREAAADLIARGLPFFVTLVESGYGQSRLAIGVDAVRDSLFLAEGSERRPGEAPIKVLVERYAAFGPRCFLAVPAAHAAKLDGLDLPDSAGFEALYKLQSQVLDRKFADAKATLAAIQTDLAGHRLAKVAALAWARATQHPVLQLDALNALLDEYPHDSTYVLSKATVLRELGRIGERSELLAVEGSKFDSDPLLMQSLAQVLLPDPARQYDATRLLRRSVRLRPPAAAGYFLLASQRWEHQRFDEAVELYRIAACLDDREDQFSDAYFRAAKCRGQAPDAVRLFQQKATRAAVPAPPAVRALYTALLDRDEPEQAASSLDRALEKLAALPTPNAEQTASHGELLLFRAEQHAGFGRFPQADADLSAARPLVPPLAWYKASARIARTKPDFSTALANVLELLALDPLNVEGHRIAAGLTAETDGREAARKHLIAVATAYPDVYPIVRLLAEFAARDPDDSSIEWTKRLAALCPHDAWSQRQLALVYADRRKPEEAFGAAIAAGMIEPDHPSQFAVLGHVHRRADRTDDAIATFRAGVAAHPDHDLLISEYVSSCRGKKEKKAALRFVAEQLRKSPHTGDGLVAYFEQATRMIEEPEDLEKAFAQVERFLDERPDLWQAWSLASQSLVRMHRAEEAIATSKDAVARFPLQPRLWVDLAEAYQETDAEEDRIDALRQAAAVAPGWTPVAKELADALAESDEDAEAIAVLERAVQRNPLDHWAHWALADKLWHADRGREALDRAKQSVRLEPGHDPERPPGPEIAWGAVVVWSDKLDCPEEAAELARELTRDRAGDPKAWLRLARHIHDSDQAAEVLAALDKAIALDPRNVEAHDLRAERLAQLGRFEEALEAARPTTLATDLPLVLQGRAAWIEARRGNYAAAIPPMQALVAVDPEYVWGWQQLAEWYNDTGKAESYLEAAGELVRLRPEHPMSLTMRGEAKLQTGDREGGKSDLREVLRIVPQYSPAALILFDACLADGEYRDARSSLAVLSEHLSGPEVPVKQVQLACRTADPDAACRAFADLCQTEGEGPPMFLQMALTEMKNADLEERAQELMREAWENGEPFHPWAAIFWLDTPAADEAPPEDRIAACDAVVKHYPTFVPGYDRRAEQLAMIGRLDEAAAACEPPGVNPIPVALRGRAAWVLAQSGDREAAIEKMKQVVAEESDYSWGWRQLATWADALGRPQECAEAADHLVRLNPDDPVALGLRGEARRILGDHRSARDDFEKAFELDPSFDAAGLHLVAEQLATDDLSGAERTLNKLREHADGPLVKLRAVQVMARLGNLAQARAAFKSLGSDPAATRGILREAASALGDAGWEAEADDDLLALTDDPTATPAAAGLWAERLLQAGEPQSVSDRLPRLVELCRPAGREAVVTYAWGMAVLERPDAVAAAVQRYADLLREDDDGWARAGAALLEAKRYDHAAAWLADWKDREDVDAWMLRPLAAALRALDRDTEANDVVRAGVERGGLDVPPEYWAWLALDEIVAGRADESEALLKRIDTVGLDDGTRLLVAMASAAVRVSRDPSAFSDAKEDLRTAAGSCSAGDVPPGAGRWYRKILDRISADAGTLGAKGWAVWQRIRPWIKG